MPAPIDSEAIARIIELCKELGVVRLELVGSAATDEFDPHESDFDFLVDFGDARRSGLDDRYFKLLAALEDLLNKPIDLIEAGRIMNPVVRASLERSRVPIYAAA